MAFKLVQIQTTHVISSEQWGYSEQCMRSTVKLFECEYPFHQVSDKNLILVGMFVSISDIPLRGAKNATMCIRCQFASDHNTKIRCNMKRHFMDPSPVPNSTEDIDHIRSRFNAVYSFQTVECLKFSSHELCVNGIVCFPIVSTIYP